MIANEWFRSTPPFALVAMDSPKPKNSGDFRFVSFIPTVRTIAITLLLLRTYRNSVRGHRSEQSGDAPLCGPSSRIKAYINKKLGDPATAEDLTQEAFLRLSEGGGGAITHGWAWLYRTAHNLAVDHGRQAARRRTDTADMESVGTIADESPSPEHIVADRMELDRLTRIIEELPERTQKVFVAVRVDGRTYAEAAELLGISESSVQKYLARAVHHVMRRMKS